jgi:hypothetical protein
MRINPNGLIGGCPALVVRKALRHLRVWDQWGVADLEAVAALAPGPGDALVKALRTEGLIEASARGAWSVTQAGRTFSVASAARPVTRATAEKALAEFLDRVEQVNCDPYFLGKVIRAVLFGSMLKPEVMRISDLLSNWSRRRQTSTGPASRTIDGQRNWPRKESSSGTSSTGNYAGISKRGISSRAEAV